MIDAVAQAWRCWPHTMAAVLSRGEYQTPPHVQLISKAIVEAVDAGGGLLVIEAPPRHSKSETVSRWLPVWYLSQYPRRHVVLASYSGTIAASNGRDVRERIVEHGERLGVRVSSNSSAIDRWHTSAGGSCTSVGVGGSLTGFGGHCLPAWTLVSTPHGRVRIDDIALSGETRHVIGFDHAENRTKTCPVKAVANRQSAWIYRITTESGRVVEATGNHRIYTGRGYVEADSVAAGDYLLCAVREASDCACMRCQKEPSPHRGTSALLLEVVQRSRHYGGEARQEAVSVRNSATEEADMVRSVSQGGDGLKESGDRRSQYDPVRGMQQAFLAEDGNRGALQPALPGAVAFSANESRAQPSMEERRHAQEDGTIQFKDVSADSAIGGGARCERVHGLRRNHPTAGASHRQRPDEQPILELSDVVPVMSCASACGGVFDTEPDTVAMVERVRHDSVVYDLQVEGCENFFANGVLVHNCLIVDDPIKDSEEAESEVMRTKVIDWFQSVLWTRREPGAVVVVMATRWHQDDLTGWILAHPELSKFVRRIRLPALAEEDDILGRSLNEPLWPEQHDAEALRQARAPLSDRWWNALFQQRPTSTEGAEIKRAWWRWYDEVPVPRAQMDFVVASWDCAFRGTASADYVVGQVWGVYGADRYLLDQFRDRMDFTATVQAVQTLNEKWRPNATLVEAKANGDAVINVLSKHIPGIVPVEPIGGKESRARAASPQIMAGNVYLPKTKYAEELVEEAAAFPLGKHDDMVDACSQALNWLLHWQRTHVSHLQAGDNRFVPPHVESERRRSMAGLGTAIGLRRGI